TGATKSCSRIHRATFVWPGSWSTSINNQMSSSIRKVWTFRSDSNAALEYETLQYSDGSTSCNCKGWTRRVTPVGGRSCKHTRLVDLGAADRHCVATHDYEISPQSQPHSNHAKRQSISIPKLGQRKFAI